MRRLSGRRFSLWIEPYAALISVRPCNRPLSRPASLPDPAAVPYWSISLSTLTAEFGLGLVDLAKNAPKDQARFLAEAAARALKQSITTRPQYPGQAGCA
jgi:hypothetical protein